MSGAAAEAAPDRLPRARWHVPAVGAVGAVLVAICLTLAVIGPMIAPYQAGQIVSAHVFGPMTSRHLLGTDYLGRDMLSRILIGARYTIGVAASATLLAAAAGVTLGMFAAVSGGLPDAVLSRCMDTLISFPSLIFSLVVVAALGSSIPVLVGTAAVIYTPGSFRIARAIAVDINAMDYVKVARARGERTVRIMHEEILPNMALPALTDLGLRFVFIVLLLSSLSFLGVGIQPPFADWGALVRENIAGLSYGAPAVIVPAIAIAVLTVGVNILIDNLPRRRAASGGR